MLEPRRSSRVRSAGSLWAGAEGEAREMEMEKKLSACE